MLIFYSQEISSAQSEAEYLRVFRFLYGSEVTIRSAIGRLIVAAFIIFISIGCSRKSSDGSPPSESATGSLQDSAIVDADSEAEAVRSFVEETAADGRVPSGAEAAVRTEEQVASFLAERYTEYFQKYALSCEPAAVRLIIAALGIGDKGEDQILELLPKHPVNPDIGFVVADLNGATTNPDGTINWSNYGAHAPVVASVIDRLFYDYGLSHLYKAEIRRISNPELRTFLDEEPSCLAALIWVAAFVEGGQKPQKNALGQVYGEHVQVVSPILDEAGRLVVYDVWPWPDQPFHIWNPLNRDLFDYQTVLIMAQSS